MENPRVKPLAAAAILIAAAGAMSPLYPDVALWTVGAALMLMLLALVPRWSEVRISLRSPVGFQSAETVGHSLQSTGTTQRRTLPKKGLQDWLKPRRMRALENELRHRDRELQQHLSAMKYGDKLLNETPLASADQSILATEMAKLCPFVTRAGGTFKKLMADVLGKMAFANGDRPERDPRYWLALQIRETVFNRLEATQQRFETTVEAGEDGREALTAFLDCYENGKRWLMAMGEFLGDPAEDSREFWEWRPCDQQLSEKVREASLLPQFSDVHRYLASEKRFRAIALENLPTREGPPTRRSPRQSSP